MPIDHATDARATLSLDHIGVIVNDLDAGAKTWRDLGFTLTRRSPQMGLNANRNAFEPWATANHCAVFEVGYLELIGIHRPDRPNPWAPFLARFEGGHIAAFRCGHADAMYQAIQDHTEDFDPPVDRRRDAPVEQGTQEMRFRNIFSRDDRVSEGRYIIIEHQTPEVLWRPSVMKHPNGVQSIEQIVLVANEPETPLARLHHMGGRQSDASRDNDTTLTLPGGGSLRCMDRSAFAERYPGEAGHDRRFAAATLGCSDLEHTRQWLRANGTPMRERDSRIWIPSDSANGCVIEFVPQQRFN
ncbi:MAG: VOC family protein [Pseudomonadota bacterium]